MLKSFNVMKCDIQSRPAAGASAGFAAQPAASEKSRVVLRAGTRGKMRRMHAALMGIPNSEDSRCRD